MNRNNTPFTEIASYYDILMKDIDYEDWVKYILDIAGIYEVKDSPMLDVSCGTGNSTYPFNSRGIDTYGVDNSYNMLRIAQIKVPDSSFIQADARALPFGKYFNFVISIFDSLNYITDFEELVQAFKSIHGVILKGGHFIFDINTPYGLKTISGRDVRKENDDVMSVWRNDYSEEKKELTLHLTLFIKKGKFWKRIDEIHKEKGYSEEEIRKGLREVGFDVLDTYKCFEHSCVDKFTKRILYIALKK